MSLSLTPNNPKDKKPPAGQGVADKRVHERLIHDFAIGKINKTMKKGEALFFHPSQPAFNASGALVFF